MKRSLHLTHTDIESDSRILKEMGALVAAGYSVSGRGVRLDEGAEKSRIGFEAVVDSIQLRSRKLHFLPRTLRHIFSLVELIAKMLPQAIRHRPAIIHCHDTLVLPLGVIVKLFTRARLIYDAHELESDRNGLTKMQSKLTLWVEKLLWRFVDGLIVVSPSIQAWYLNKLGPKRSTVILNSPLLGQDKLEKNDYLRTKFSIPFEHKIFIYVGILGPGRGIDLVVDTFKDPEIQSHVVFLGYGELSNELKDLAKLHPTIHVHDAVPHAQVVPVVQSADCGLCLVQNVSLSDYYCLPNKLFEYCFADVPVIASDFPDIRSVLSDHNIGLTCRLELNEVKRVIKRFETENLSFSFEDLTPLSWQSQENKLTIFYNEIVSL